MHTDGAMHGRAAVPSAAVSRQDGGSPSGQAAPAGALVATIMGNGIYGRLDRVSRLGTYANDLQLGAKWSAEFCHIIWDHAIM